MVRGGGMGYEEPSGPPPCLGRRPTTLWRRSVVGMARDLPETRRLPDEKTEQGRERGLPFYLRKTINVPRWYTFIKMCKVI